MAMRARAGLAQRSEPLVGASPVCAVPCIVVFAGAVLPSPQQRTMSSLFLPRPPMNAPNRLKHDEIKNDGFRGRA